MTLGNRILFSAITVGLVALAPSIYAVFQFREIERIFALSDAAGEVRRSLENVEDSSHEYSHFIEAGGDPLSDRGQQLLRTWAATDIADCAGEAASAEAAMMVTVYFTSNLPFSFAGNRCCEGA